MSDAYMSEVQEHGGYRFRIDYEYDHDCRPPWEEYDGLGVITGPHFGRSKKPSERILWCSDRNDKWYYDWQATMRKAYLESWGLGGERVAELVAMLGRPPTRGEIAEEAVRRDFKYCRDFLRGEWWYCGVIVTRLEDDPEHDRNTSTDYSHALWRVEDGWGDYGQHKEEVVQQLIVELLNELDTPTYADQEVASWT